MKFYDLELRLAGRSDMQVLIENPQGCWPYGVLYLYLEGGSFYAVFGDLRIRLSLEELEKVLKQII